MRNPLKRKDLNENGAERKTVQGEKIEIGKWQTRGRIAQKYMVCQFICWLSFEWGRKTLKREVLSDQIGTFGRLVRRGGLAPRQERGRRDDHGSAALTAGARHMVSYKFES